MNFFRWGAIAFLASATAFCAEEFKQENKPDNLKALFVLLHQTIHEKKDLKAAAALFGTLFPDEARIKKGLKDDIAPEILQKILTMHKTMPPPAEKSMANMAKPDQTSVEILCGGGVNPFRNTKRVQSRSRNFPAALNAWRKKPCGRTRHITKWLISCPVKRAE